MTVGLWTAGLTDRCGLRVTAVRSSGTGRRARTKRSPAWRLSTGRRTLTAVRSVAARGVPPVVPPGRCRPPSAGLVRGAGVTALRGARAGRARESAVLIVRRGGPGRFRRSLRVAGPVPPTIRFTVGSEIAERIAARRAELNELDELERQLVNQLHQVRAERDELAVAERVWQRMAERLAVHAGPAVRDGQHHSASDLRRRRPGRRRLRADRRSTGASGRGPRQAGAAARVAGQARRAGLAAQATRRPLRRTPVTRSAARLVVLSGRSAACECGSGSRSGIGYGRCGFRIFVSSVSKVSCSRASRPANSPEACSRVLSASHRSCPCAVRARTRLRPSAG